FCIRFFFGLFLRLGLGFRLGRRFDRADRARAAGRQARHVLLQALQRLDAAGLHAGAMRDVVVAAGRADRAALRVGRRLRKRRHDKGKCCGCGQRGKRRHLFRDAVHVTKSLGVVDGSRRFNRIEIQKKAGRKIRQYHFISWVPPQANFGSRRMRIVDRAMPRCQTLIMRLPRFSPASSPIKALGVFSSPLMTSSWTLSWPELTHDCRSLNASSRWSMKSITIKPCMMRRFTTIRPGTPRGPVADGTPSYCEIAPQQAMRPRLFICARHASRMSPPTLSK